MRTRAGVSTKLILVLGVVALTIGVAACGGDDDESAASEEGGSGDASAVSGEFPVTIETTEGPVTIEEPAERVVALEWGLVEDLLALGVTPVGVADIEGYNTWVHISEELPTDGVEDVGTRQEPSLERIRALDPDLIVTHPDRAAENMEQLQDIAPTLSLDAIPMEGQWEAMGQLVRDLGAATGRVDQAEQVMADLETAIDETSEEIAGLNLETNRYILGLGGTSNGVPGFRLSTDNALMVEALQKVGLDNAWDAPAAEWGFTESTVEALAEVEGDLHFFYVVEESDDIVDGALADNDLWQGLSFVESGQIHSLGGDTWFYGGPLSVQTLYDRVTEALAG